MVAVHEYDMYIVHLRQATHFVAFGLSILHIPSKAPSLTVTFNFMLIIILNYIDW